MNTAVERFFKQRIAGPPNGQSTRDESLQLAALALLEEAAQEQVSWDWQDLPLDEVHLVIGRAFGLAPERIEEVITLTESEAHDADCTGFAHLVRHYCTAEQKARVAELLWEACAAGGQLDHYEEDLIGKAAAAIDLPGKELAAARDRVVLVTARP